MKQTLLMKLTALAGLMCSCAAFGQTSQFELQLVLDNDPRLAAMGVNFGPNARLPGPQATAVGVTLIARVTTQGTTPNFGLQTFGGGGTSTAPNSIFYHDDTISNQTTAAWTSAALAFQRGNIDSSTSPNAQRGLMSYTQPANYTGAGEAAQQVSFRSQVGGQNPNRNSARTNGSQTTATNQNQPVNFGYNNFASVGANSNNANGWIGINRFGDFDGTRSAVSSNTYENVPGSAAILAVTGIRSFVPTQVDSQGEPVPTFVNFGGTVFTPFPTGAAIAGFDQDTVQSGVQSAWQAVYRLVFTPRESDLPALGGLPNGARDVSVFVSGQSLGAVSATLATGGAEWFLSAALPYVAGSASITFQVPGPGSASVLVVALAIASRRRR